MDTSHKRGISYVFHFNLYNLYSSKFSRDSFALSCNIKVPSLLLPISENYNPHVLSEHDAIWLFRALGLLLLPSATFLARKIYSSIANCVWSHTPSHAHESPLTAAGACIYWRWQLTYRQQNTLNNWQPCHPFLSASVLVGANIWRQLTALDPKRSPLISD